jgi:parallel beta-helix repeat protein
MNNKLLLTISGLILIMMSMNAYAATYYVDATSGLDSNNGLSNVTAWKTLAKVSNTSFTPGDNILLKSGEVWREQLKVNQSGNRSNVITYSSYGAGHKPIINGANLVTGWSLYQGSIYVANVSYNVSYVYVNGTWYNFSHYPNTGYLRSDNPYYSSNANRTNTSLLDNDLGLTFDQVNGSTIYIKSSTWNIDKRTVIDYNVTNKTMSIYPETTGDYYIDEGEGYYLADKLWMLDSPGEWFYDTNQSKLYLWMLDGSNPSSSTVEAVNRSYGIYANSRNNILINNFEIKYTNSTGIFFAGTNANTTINNVNISNTGTKGIEIRGWWTNGGNNTVSNSLFNGNDYSGIYFYDSLNSSIINNTVTNLGMYGPVTNAQAGINMYNSNDSIVANNTVLNSGYLGIEFSGSRILVKNNLIDGYCIRLDDGGGIYTYTDSLTTSVQSAGSVIIDNIVLNGIGNPEGERYSNSNHYGANGIYLDGFSKMISVINNTVINVGSSGSHNNNPQGHNISGNTFYNAQSDALDLTEFPGSSELTNLIVEKNIFYTITNLSRGADSNAYISALTESQLNNFGTFDYNYYWQPFGYSSAGLYSSETDKTRYYNTSLWAAATGNESHGKEINSFYTFKEYRVDQNGSEKLSNGNFDAGITNWTTDSSHTWMSDCSAYGLSGGCYKVYEWNESRINTSWIYTNNRHFALDDNKTYLLSLTIYSNNSDTLRILLRSNTTSVGYHIYALTEIGYNNGTKKYEFLINSDQTNTTRIDFMTKRDHTYYLIDNISLKEVNVTKTNVKDASIILYNTEFVNKTFSLNGTDYCDVDGNKVSGSVEVRPFRSMVLLSCFCNNDFVCNNNESYNTCPNDCAQEHKDYFDWNVRLDRHSKPAGIFNETPFPINENSTNYTVMNDEYPQGKTYFLGTKYYVDGGFNGPIYSGNWTNPWKNITAALSSVSNGSATIIIRGSHDSFNGIYNEYGLTLKSGINDTYRFTIVGYGQERPIINGSSNTTDSISASGSVSYSTLQRVKFQDNDRSGVRTSSDDSYLNIIDVWLYNNNKYNFVSNQTYGDGNLYFLSTDNSWIFHSSSEHTYGHCFKIGDDARIMDEFTRIGWPKIFVEKELAKARKKKADDKDLII